MAAYIIKRASNWHTQNLLIHCGYVTIDRYNSMKSSVYVAETHGAASIMIIIIVDTTQH